MGRYFQDLDYPHFDYRLGEVAELPGWQFRGPVPDLDKPFFVCIGAAQMFGRFCNDPYAHLLSKALDLPVLNLGVSGSGPAVFLDDAFLAVANRAQFAVVQVMSARCESNAEFVASKSGGAQGTRLLDGRQMLFDEYLAEKLASSSRDSVARAVGETRANWVAHYRELLNAIHVPTVLHWFSTITPRRSDDFSAWWKLLGPFPQLVSKTMLYQILPFAHSFVQTVGSTGLPQPLWPSSEPVDGTELYDGTLINTYYPSPEMHEAAARDLLEPCRALGLGLPADRSLPSTVAKDVFVVSVNELEGAIIADLFGSKAMCIPYQKVLEDRGMLPFLAARQPHFVHVKRRNLLDGYLDAMSARRSASSASPTYVDPAAFAAYVHSVSTAERRISAALAKASVNEVLFEDFAADPRQVMARLASAMQRQEPADAAVSAAADRIYAPRTPQNPGELQALFNRALKSIPKAGE